MKNSDIPGSYLVVGTIRPKETAANSVWRNWSSIIQETGLSSPRTVLLDLLVYAAPFPKGISESLGGHPWELSRWLGGFLNLRTVGLWAL